MTYKFSSSKIDINGTVYDSLDEVPEEHKELLNSLKDYDFSSEQTVTHNTYMYNGVSYDNVEDLPEEAKRFIGDSDLSITQAYRDQSEKDSGQNARAEGIHEALLESLKKISQSGSEQSFQYKQQMTSQKFDDISLNHEAEPYQNTVKNQGNRRATTKDKHYTSAVQKQNSSYSWLYVIVIIALLGVIAWQYLA